MQVDVIPLKSILFGSQFKLVFLTGWACWIALGLLMLFVPLIAPSALTINGEVAQGIGDGFVAFVIAVLVGGAMSALCSVIGCGALGFMGKFISLGNISYNSDGV